MDTIETRYDLNDFLAIGKNHYAVLACCTYQPKTNYGTDDTQSPVVELYCLWDVHASEIPETHILLLCDANGVYEIYAMGPGLLPQVLSESLFKGDSLRTVYVGDWKRTSRKGWKVHDIVATVGYSRAWDEHTKNTSLKLVSLSKEDDRIVRVSKTLYGHKIDPNSVSRTMMTGEERKIVAAFHEKTEDRVQKKHSLYIIGAVFAVVIVGIMIATPLLTSSKPEPNSIATTKTDTGYTRLSSRTSSSIGEYLKNVDKRAGYKPVREEASSLDAYWHFYFHKEGYPTVDSITKGLTDLLGEELETGVSNEDGTAAMLFTADEVVVVFESDSSDSSYVDAVVVSRKELYVHGDFHGIFDDNVLQWALKTYGEYGYPYDADRNWGESQFDENATY